MTTRTRCRLLQTVLLTLYVSRASPSILPSQSGCADSSTEGLQRGVHDQLAACDGRWSGHVDNASTLCAAGWTVCGWNTLDLLRTLSAEDAATLRGCYALNAAERDGLCRPCRHGQDDLAGVGSGCKRRDGDRSDVCFSGGDRLMNVSDADDGSGNRSCTYRAGLVTGVLCCQHSGELPHIVIEPPALTHVRSGEMFVLSCQAVGRPVPRIHWLLDGQQVPIDRSMPRRVAAFQSGYLIVSQAQTSDSGVYRCLASNPLGNATAPARVIVTEHSSGCADGKTDGLWNYEEVQACGGRWQGHVKRAARTLCAAGWQVCGPRHSSALTLLTWTDVTQLPGCYAYNAANTLNLCSVCRRGDMAGVGRDCGRHRPGRRSCLADGLIDVSYRRSSASGKRRQSKPCNFVSGVTTGVLCCKRLEKWQLGYNWRSPKCKPRCQNGGVCVADGQCKCAPGYKGTACQNPICPGGCIPNSECVRPSLCRCLDGFTGPKCRPPAPYNGSSSRRYHTRPHSHVENEVTVPGDIRSTGRCRCLNGGRCVRNRCKCRPGFTGPTCRSVVKVQRRPVKTNEAQLPSDINRTE